METYEHTKCKPLSIVTVVDEKNQNHPGTKAMSHAGQRVLAKIARKKYGPRPDCRLGTLKSVLKVVKPWVSAEPNLKIRPVSPLPSGC